MHCFKAFAALVSICRDRSGSSTARAMEIAAASGWAAGAGDIRGDSGHAAARLGMIPMQRAEVTVDERGVSPLPAELGGRDGPCAALAQGPLGGLGDEVLS